MWAKRQIVVRPIAVPERGGAELTLSLRCVPTTGPGPSSGWGFSSSADATGPQIRIWARFHRASSCLTSAARCGGTGAASASYWSLRDCTITVRATYLYRLEIELLRVSQGTI